MNFRNLILAGSALALVAASAAAQVNVVPQAGLITNILKNPTYAAYSVGLVPAASATDIFCISPGTSKNISIKKLILSGTAGTAITTPVLVYRRASLDTGGTAATSLALPVAAPLLASDPASGATLTAYTANPTVNDSSPVLLSAAAVSFAVTTTANYPTIIPFSTGVDMFERGVDLQKNTTQQICLNLNGVSISSGVLTVGIEWQESN